MNKYINEASEDIKENIIRIISIPIVIDIIFLFTYKGIFKTEFVPSISLINFKIGSIGLPPSGAFLIGNFPGNIDKYLLTNLSLELLLKYLIFILIFTFVISGYSSLIIYSKQASLGMFFREGFNNWNKIFIVYMPNYVLSLVFITDSPFNVLVFIMSMVYNLLIFYMVPSIIYHKKNILKSYYYSFRMLMDNLGETIKLMLLFDFYFLLLNSVVFILIKLLGNIGLYISIVAIAYLGVISNKSFIKLYELKKGEMYEKKA